VAAHEVPTPKYLRVLNTLRERIEEGTYGPGAALPSESQLSTEFGVTRPTVLKALGILRQDGWIESQQGRGHFVRGRPPDRSALAAAGA
jgi:GntR family transcriptional regulator